MATLHDSEAANVVALDSAKANDVAAQITDKGVRFVDLVQDARQADEREHVDLGVIKAFRTHWKVRS
jgi:malonyl CoA-acyl carrier protein transacylase